MSDSLTQCPLCKRDVPICNKDLHIARCSRRHKESNSSVPGSSDISSPVICIDDENDWKMDSNNRETGLGSTTGHSSSATTTPHIIDLLNESEPSAPLAPSLGFGVPVSPAVEAVRPCPHCNALINMSSECCNGCGRETSRNWECQYCTYFNMPAAPHCEICSKSRYGDMMSSAVNDDMDIDFDGWRCSKCTYENRRNGLIACEMCGNRAPGIAVSQDSGIISSSSSSTSSISSDSNILPATVFGSLLGAGTAYLDNRSVLNGAIQGAGMGLVGGLLMDQQGAEVRHRNSRAGTSYFTAQGRRYHAAGRPGPEYLSGRFSSSGGMLGHNMRFNYDRSFGLPLVYGAGLDIDNMDYEQLYSRLVL